MTYYHVRITVKDENHDETRVDLSEDALERGILDPYRSGSPITVNGRTLTIDKVERIRVSASDEPSDVLISMIRDENARSRVAVVGGPSLKWRAAARARDITDQFITGPPGLTATASPPPSKVGPGDKRSVFVVAGRDNIAVSETLAFIRSLGLRIVEWEHAVARTGLPNPYVGDVVATGMTMADATLVLLTPDDLVQLRKDLVRDEDGADERGQVGQPRPNVFYEAGFADGLGRDRTLIVEVGQVKPFTDVLGRHIVRFDGSAGKRNALAERLRIAGLEPDTSGTDWLTAGDIAGAIATARQALDRHISPGDGGADENKP